MRRLHCSLGLLILLPGALAGSLIAGRLVRAADLTVTIHNGEKVTLVGAMKRWDEDGKPLEQVDPKAKIDEPKVDAEAKSTDGTHFVFKNLPKGRYDLVIMAKDRVRIEGFAYPPIMEFDPILAPDAEAPEEARAWIIKDISKSAHYENKVSPLYLAGDEKTVRILMQLVRDKPTSYDGDVGYQVATVRHEVWQYTFRYGGWVKERKTAVLDRTLLPRSDFHKWTWVWEPRLGNIKMGSKPVDVDYDLPERFDPESVKGWFAD